MATIAIDSMILIYAAMIVAAAKSAGATVFYSHDKKCLGLAKMEMDGRDLPKSDPNDMFLKEDIRRGEV
jgi:hypothetical protein